jgi:hypothetical protein
MMSGRRPALRRYGTAAALALMTLVLPACAAHSSPGPALRTPSAPAAGADAAQLQIMQVRVGNAVPMEGAIAFIRIERATGAPVIDRRLPGSGKLALWLEPGAYRLASWQRFCDANCGNLDPPSSRCVRPVTVRRHEQLVAIIRVNFAAGCVIALHR